MDSTPLSVRSAPLADLSAGLDDTGATLAATPAVTALGAADSTSLALGLIAGDLVAVLLRLAVENHRATADAGAALRRIAEATATSARAYRATDDDAAGRLRDVGTAA
ncbi:type VII secretion target [Williamsia serinedens]|uniref:Excreted virulence factor EspC, type VII ESX diderm n=2 Tax=Williamsia serinedens TaxID=391736 RepID=A0ABT1H3D4_9NOCA|nr:type VII secretion target [Williamsia serinedens]MCP2160342.1 Excreted virulence factor EspC, type VII ESX diderm [Williamsia serinedens]